MDRRAPATGRRRVPSRPAARRSSATSSGWTPASRRRAAHRGRGPDVRRLPRTPASCASVRRRRQPCSSASVTASAGCARSVAVDSARWLDDPAAPPTAGASPPSHAGSAAGSVTGPSVLFDAARAPSAASLTTGRGPRPRRSAPTPSASRSSAGATCYVVSAARRDRDSGWQAQGVATHLAGLAPCAATASASRPEPAGGRDLRVWRGAAATPRVRFAASLAAAGGITRGASSSRTGRKSARVSRVLCRDA